MIPVNDLHRTLRTTANDLEHLGAVTWQRFDDWSDKPEMARDILRGGGLGDERSEAAAENAMLDRIAAGYYSELDDLTRRMDADAARLRHLLRIANPDQPRSLRPGDMTAAQLAADGWCSSCFRNDRTLNPVAEGRYRDRCRPCGELRAREQRDPTLDELRLMHSRGKSLRQRVA